jgi:hypothetical protein
MFNLKLDKGKDEGGHIDQDEVERQDRSLKKGSVVAVMFTGMFTFCPPERVEEEDVASNFNIGPNIIHPKSRINSPNFDSTYLPSHPH